MKRIVDIVCALVAMALLAAPFLLLVVLVRVTSRGPILYWSDRVGRDNKLFKMPKLRTMLVGTPAVATHLLDDAQSYLTPLGGLLRRTSLDEIPQVLSILSGEMSVVGPRPALFNQDDLISLRSERGVHRLRPGLTGWAQVNGRDDMPIPTKVAYDEYYLQNQSLLFDLRIILMTSAKVLSREGVSH
jgi:O-antigen biosynthesis protein WbqP